MEAETVAQPVEEAMKIIVSGGVVAPAMINVSKTQLFAKKSA